MDKHITQPIYQKILDALIIYVEQRSDGYEYLYSLINGREFGKPGQGNQKSTVMKMSWIKKLWNDSRMYIKVAKLCVFVHYIGHRVDISEYSCIRISDDFVRRYALRICSEYKNGFEEETDNENLRKVCEN